MALLVGAGGLRAADSWDTLLQNSPFGAVAPGATAVTTAGAPEFRGYSTEGREQFFSVYDPASQRAYWLRRGETAGALEIRDFAADRLVLNIEYQGRVLPLPLHQAKVLAAAPPASPGPAPTSTNPASAVPAGEPDARQIQAAQLRAQQIQAMEAKSRVMAKTILQAYTARTGAAK